MNTIIAGFHEWKCASAPIFNDNDIPIASLTISSHISCKDIHTLTLTTSCANCISIRLRESALIDTEKRLNAMLQRVLNSLPEAVVAIDGNGSITHANNKAANYLLPKNGVLVGKNIDDLFPKPELPRVRQFMRRGVPETGDVTILTHEGERTHFCRFEPIQLSNGDFGMTLSISMKSQIINIANHAGGNYAKYSFDAIRGKSPELKAQIDLARRTARTASRVLLTGESGTGKELFAQAIHNSSSVCKGPFVAVSCAAIPRDLIESELFGYVGGAFTGARKGGMIGKMELAKGGARCSSTRSTACPSKCRPSCCARCSRWRSCASVTPSRRPWTCASSPRPTRISRTPWRRGRSGRPVFPAERH